MKVPIPVPSVVLLSEVVGVALAELQQTPLAVTGSPPSEETVPPELAELAVTFVTIDAARVGKTFGGSFLQPNIRIKRDPKINEQKTEVVFMAEDLCLNYPNLAINF